MFAMLLSHEKRGRNSRDTVFNVMFSTEDPILSLFVETLFLDYQFKFTPKLNFKGTVALV